MIEAVLENRFLSNWSALLPRAPYQLNSIHESDSELIPLGDGRVLAITVDSICEEIAHGLYRDPRTAGCMAVIASVSDLAAVGAEPIGLLSAVSLPHGDGEMIQREIALGMAEASSAAGTFILGGDTNEQPNLAVSCVAIGTAEAGQEITRKGAQPGDVVFVSGPLGLGSALAASVLLGIEGGLTEQEFRPEIRLKEGKILRGLASACIDTSDGFIGALDQLMRLNGVSIRINAALSNLLHRDAYRLSQRSGLPGFSFLASIHGEYELLFTVPRAKVDQLRQRAGQCNWRPIEVGHVEPGHGISWGSAAIDSARIRNLWSATRGDVASYVAQLTELSAGLE